MSQLLSQYPTIVTMHAGKMPALRVALPWHPDVFMGQSLLLRVKPGQKKHEILDRLDHYWATLRELLRQRLEEGTGLDNLVHTSYLTFCEPFAENDDV